MNSSEFKRWFGRKRVFELQVSFFRTSRNFKERVGKDELRRVECMSKLNASPMFCSRSSRRAGKVEFCFEEFIAMLRLSFNTFIWQSRAGFKRESMKDFVDDLALLTACVCFTQLHYVVWWRGHCNCSMAKQNCTHEWWRLFLVLKSICQLASRNCCRNKCIDGIFSFLS